jgi:Leucine-rich repeat (LRR) protein
MSVDKKLIKNLSNVIEKEFIEVSVIRDTYIGYTYKLEEDNITEIGLDLSKLELNEKKLVLIGEIIQNLQHLKKLYIKFLMGEAIPSWLFQLTNLEDLSLRENNLNSIPEGIKNFSLLKSLNLASNMITILPEWISGLHDLKELNLEHNDNLEWNQGNLEILRALKDKGTKIKAIRLFNFQLEYNLPIEQIEIIRELEKENIEKEKMKQYVNPVNVKIEEGKITQWRMFEYSFKALPENFGVFKDLKSLTITHTPLKTLPESFGNLRNLESLDLSFNHLEQLPETFRNLKSISTLNLSNNRFNEIPTQLWSFNLLTDLNLSNNPLTDEEKTIIQKVPDAIRDYLRKKATITIFISHAVIDFERYEIGKLVEYLKSQKEISEVYFCEEDLAGNIDEWMLNTVQKSQLLLFVASKKSLFESVDCRNELQLAEKFSIPIIPLKGNDVEWNDLAELKLSRELGIEFDKTNFESFCADLYKYIFNFKREIDLMSEKGRKQGITDIYERFRLILNENIDQLKRKIDQLEQRVKKLEN